MSDSLLDRARAIVAAEPEIGRFELGKRLSIGENKARGLLNQIRRSTTVEDETVTATKSEEHKISGDTWEISLPRTRICSLEELIEHCKIDLLLWEVDRWVCNKWEVGAKDASKKIVVEPLFQVKAWLKKRIKVQAAIDEIESLRKKAETFSPRYPAIICRDMKQSGTVAEYSIYDHHFGALIWGKETGAADYDTKIAKKCYEDALECLISRTKVYQPDRALIVFGNDQQNADNRAGTTERGTPQNMDSRYQKVFAVSRDASIWAVEALLSVVPFVDVEIVPGNHDPLSSWHLGDSLQIWFRNCPNVKVDNSPNPKKYYEHGVNMLMFTHGNNGKLEDYDRTMASEQPAMWGRTKWREAHTGDKHHRRLIEQKGATVRILPSLRPPCSWSAENHYVGSIRAAEAYLWNNREGLIGTACYSELDNEQVA